MYFLRRRHGRKSQTESRREKPPAAAPLYAEPAESSLEFNRDIEPPKPVVLTKPKRARIAEPADDDCKPAGTFRAGTLHIARDAESSSRHGKL